MRIVFLALSLIVVGLIRPATAQSPDDVVWVQIEAHPNLAVATNRAQRYDQALEDVNGFALGGTWYGIALGPYRRADAVQVLQVYRSQGRIPNDSYIADSRSYGRQFWPVGANVLNQGALSTPQSETQAAAQPAEPETPAEPQFKPVDETPAEARRSERLLTATERKELQIALRWAGFYEAAIDGAYGPGTRRSMGLWQDNNGYETTGILTTAQRQELLDQYNAPLISVGMALATDADAGIQMQMPTKAVKFSRYEPPFAHYDSASQDGIRLVLISQPGTQKTLFGLYDIMQTLEIVPVDGPREKRRNSFTLEGRNDRIVSYTEAVLDDGHIKGFSLIWPAGDEARRTRVLALMRESFERLPEVLDPAAGADAEQSIDLVSGLSIRRPKLSRSGFYVDASGTVVTTAEAVQSCSRITLDQDYPAEILQTDTGLGVAILRPGSALAPPRVAQFRPGQPRLKSDVAVSGFSFEGVLGAPTLTYGKLEDIKGLRGETELNRLAMAALPGDAGGPVLDAGGAVVGMLLPPPSGGRQLPDGVSFAAGSAAIASVLDGVGVSVAASQPGRASQDELNRMAQGMTVLVSCWD